MSIEETVLNNELKMVEMGIRLVKSGFKIGGELAKQLMLFTMKKIEERRENVSGVISIKELMKSKDGISSFSISSKEENKIKEMLTLCGAKFACINNHELNETRFLIEDKNLVIAKEIVQDIVRAAEERNKRENLSNETIKSFDNGTIEFKNINDEEKFYRYKVNSITKEEAIKIQDELKKNNIISTMVVTKIVDDKLNIDYKVDIKEKEKCIQTIKVASDKLKEINTQTKKENSVKNLLDRASKKSKEFNKNLSKKTSVKERVK